MIEDCSYIELGTVLEEGGTCPVGDCFGVLAYEEVHGCYCHINPPCSACTDNPLTCPDCGWSEDEL